jgi:hypothetical protein
MPEDQDSRSVEIRVPLPNGEWSRGSGYVIGPCRVLTALHVIIGEAAVWGARDVPEPGSIEVRAYGDFVERFGGPDIQIDRYFARVRAAATDGDYLWRPARLLWPPVGARIPEYELAILAIAPADALKHIRDAPRIGCFKPSADISCRATGFPKWKAAQTSDGVDLSNPGAVTGTLTFGPPTNQSFHPFTATNGAPQNAEEWRGLSGAAFVAIEARALVGVASAILPA